MHFHVVGGSMGLFSIVLVDMFGLENISKTLGIFLFCNGIGLLCGPPIESTTIYDSLHFTIFSQFGALGTQRFNETLNGVVDKRTPTALLREVKVC